MLRPPEVVQYGTFSENFRTYISEGIKTLHSHSTYREEFYYIVTAIHRHSHRCLQHGK